MVNWDICGLGAGPYFYGIEFLFLRRGGGEIWVLEVFLFFRPSCWQNLGTIKWLLMSNSEGS